MLMKVQQQIREAVFQTPKVLELEIRLRDSCRKKIKRPEKNKENDTSLEMLLLDFKVVVYSSVKRNFNK